MFWDEFVFEEVEGWECFGEEFDFSFFGALLDCMRVASVCDHYSSFYFYVFHGFL